MCERSASRKKPTPCSGGVILTGLLLLLMLEGTISLASALTAQAAESDESAERFLAQIRTKGFQMANSPHSRFLENSISREELIDRYVTNWTGSWIADRSQAEQRALLRKSKFNEIEVKHLSEHFWNCSFSTDRNLEMLFTYDFEKQIRNIQPDEEEVVQSFLKRLSNNLLVGITCRSLLYRFRQYSPKPPPALQSMISMGKKSTPEEKQKYNDNYVGVLKSRIRYNTETLKLKDATELARKYAAQYNEILQTYVNIFEAKRTPDYHWGLDPPGTAATQQPSKNPPLDVVDVDFKKCFFLPPEAPGTNSLIG